jgi:hypothetical protein
MRNVSDQRKPKHKFCIHFFTVLLDIYGIMWENMVQPDMPQVTRQYGACVLLFGKVRQEY